MNKPLLKAFSIGIKPEGKFDIIKWAKANVNLPNSDKSATADLLLTPWLIQPLQDIIDRKYDHTNCVMATGSGKSTLIEILTTYIILERPSQVGIFSQTQAASQVWMESRLLPSLKKNPRVVELLPSNRHDIKKDAILFGHMNLFVRGSSIANTQSLSLDCAISDESWIAPQDSLSYILRRKHDRAFSWSLFVSQAGITNSEFYEHVKDTTTFEYHYKCPNCGEYHPFRFVNLIFSDGKNFENIYYKCPGCGTHLQDDPQTRRYMSQNGKYIQTSTNKNQEGPTNNKNVTYIFNAGLNHMVPWSSLAREFYKANEKAKKYDYEPLKVFKTQRLSEWWNMEDIEFVQIKKSGYSLEEKTKEDVTILTVDVQGQIGDTLMWFQVRTFNRDTGESKLIDFGRFASYEDIVRKQEEWSLPGNCVGIDCAYKTDEVREFAARYGYLTLNGVQVNVFPVNVKGKMVNRVYGLIRKEKTLKGQFASYAPYASTRVKMITAGLRSSNTWKVPHDIPDFYIKQLNAEIFENGKWKQVNADNHALDLDAMALVMALVHGVHIDVEIEEETPPEN